MWVYAHTYICLSIRGQEHIDRQIDKQCMYIYLAHKYRQGLEHARKGHVDLHQRVVVLVGPVVVTADPARSRLLELRKYQAGTSWLNYALAGTPADSP